MRNVIYGPVVSAQWPPSSVSGTSEIRYYPWWYMARHFPAAIGSIKIAKVAVPRANGGCDLVRPFQLHGIRRVETDRASSIANF